MEGRRDAVGNALLCGMVGVWWASGGAALDLSLERREGGWESEFLESLLSLPPHVSPNILSLFQALVCVEKLPRYGKGGVWKRKSL